MDQPEKIQGKIDDLADKHEELQRMIDYGDPELTTSKMYFQVAFS